MVDLDRQEKKGFSNQEDLDELHCDHSYKSIHHRKGNYVGSPGADTFQVGGKSKEGDEEGDATGYGNLSTAELIALLKQHKIAPGQTVGSPPKSKRSGSGHGAEEEEESSSSGSSSSETDDSSIESVTPGEASPSSAEGDTMGRKPGQGE